jgi:hypothetical protein
LEYIRTVLQIYYPLELQLPVKYRLSTDSTVLALKLSMAVSMNALLSKYHSMVAGRLSLRTEDKRLSLLLWSLVVSFAFVGFATETNTCTTNLKLKPRV